MFPHVDQNLSINLNRIQFFCTCGHAFCDGWVQFVMVGSSLVNPRSRGSERTKKLNHHDVRGSLEIDRELLWRTSRVDRAMFALLVSVE